MYNPFLRKFGTLPKTSYIVASVPDLLRGLFIGCCGRFYRPRCQTTPQTSCGAIVVVVAGGVPIEQLHQVFVEPIRFLSNGRAQKFFSPSLGPESKKEISVWRGKISYFLFLCFLCAKRKKGDDDLLAQPTYQVL